MGVMEAVGLYGTGGCERGRGGALEISISDGNVGRRWVFCCYLAETAVPAACDSFLRRILGLSQGRFLLSLTPFLTVARS